MKKILAITAMAAFAAVSFAEGITFGAWLRALAAPVANDGKDSITQAGNSWGGAPRSARLNVTAVAPDGNAGFNMGMYNDFNDKLIPTNDDKGTWWIGPGDEANLWVKPLDIVKVSYGKYDNNTLRGDVCYGSWNWMRPTAWIAGDEGLLMSGNGDTGLMAEITPMEELYIQALVPITKDSAKAGTTYKNLRAGFAYTVPGTVKVKGQYIGKGKANEDDTYTFMDATYTEDELTALAANPTAEVIDAYDTDSDGTLDATELAAALADVEVNDGAGNSNCTLEAEVDVLAVEGLFAGVGFQYNVIKDGKDNSPDSVKTKIALGASYQVMPELKVSASGAYFMYYGEKVDPRFQAGVGVDYDLGDGLAANADFRYMSKSGYDGTKDKDSDKMAFSVGVQKNVSSNGYIGVAFQGITNSGSLGPIAGQKKDGDAKFVWAIPVALSVYF